MKQNRSYFFLSLLAMASMNQIQAANISKANNADGLDLTSSWVDGVVPGAADVAVWDSTVLAANTTALGVSASWQGMKINSPGGLVTISAGGALSLGSAGINCSSSTQSLTIDAPVSLDANQTWTTATGRTITVSGVFSNNNKVFTAAGTGMLILGNGSHSGAFNLNKIDAGTLKLGSGAGSFSMAMTAGSLIDVTAGSLINETGAANSWTFNLSSLNVAAGATFDVGDSTVIVDALTGAGIVQKGSAGSTTMNIGANHSTASYSGAVKQVAGVFTLSKMGTGSQTLSGTADNNKLLVEVKAGTLVLSKASSGAGTQGIAVRAAWGVSDIASGATLQFGTAGSGGEQIYGFGSVASTVAGTGTVAMSGGTLDFNGKSEGWNILSGSGTVRNNLVATTSTMTVGQDQGSGVFSGAIIDGVATGKMALTKQGTGTLTLSGTGNTYTGNTLVSRGVLEVTGSISGSTITVNNNATSNPGTLAGEGGVGNVTFGAGAPGPGILVDPSTPGNLSMAAVTVNGTLNVSLSNSNFTLGSPFKVLSYASKVNGWTTANFAMQGAGNYRSASFTDASNIVSVSIGASTIEWNNFSGDSLWNTNGSVNFRDGVPSNQKCYYYDSIIFGNLPAANQTIAVNGLQLPSSFTVNSTFDYTFNNGTLGSIGGVTGLLKSGSGTLTMNLSNTFTGATTITAGTLGISSDAALGAVPSSFSPAAITLNGGALRLNAATVLHANRGIMLGASGGTLDTISVGTTQLLEVSTQIGGAGPLNILANGDVNDAASGAGAITFIAGNPFVGDVTISAGLVAMNADLGNFTNQVVLNGGGLVDQNTNYYFSRNLKVGAAGGFLRAYAGVTNAEIAGSVENVSGVSSTALRHIEGGTIKLSGSGAGFAGTFTNARGATQITALDANWQNTDFVIDTNSAASALVFNGTGTAKAKSITSTRDVLIDNGTTLSVQAVTMNTNAHYLKTVTGSLGSITSSTGSLSITNGAASGLLATLDQQIQLVVKDFDGFTPLTLVKNNSNLLVLSQPNTYSGGTTINMGRVQAPVALSYGTGSVTVNSGGQAYLTTAGLTYANQFTINGIGQSEAAGTLGAIRFENNTVSGNIIVASASRLTAFAAATQGTVTGALIGIGNLETTGSGTINLNGDASAYSGTLTASQGTLNVNSAALGGSLVVANGAIFNGEPTVAGSITFGSGGTSTLNFNPLTAGSLSTNGSLAINGTVAVGITGAIPASGIYKVIGFGSKSGTWTAANFSISSNFRPGSVFTENANDVSLTLNKLPLTWTNGAANSLWDTNVSVNFRDTVPSAQKFYAGDDVTFDNTPGVAQTIVINGNQVPSSITVSSQFNYTFNLGTLGAISGSTSLIKEGTGLLSINLANTFIGGVTIRQGEVRTGNNTAAGSGTITLGDATTGSSNVSWLFNGSGTPANPVVVSALGSGTVTIGTYSTGFATPSSALLLNRAVTLQDSTADRTTFTGKISGNVGIITLTGTRVTFGNATNDFVGNILVSEGTTYQNDVANALPDATNFTLLGGASRFRLNNNSEVIGAIGGTGIIDNVIGGNTLTVGGGNGSATFSGSLTNGSGPLNLVKIGSGTQVFSGTSSYTGTTSVNGGILQLPSSTTPTGACTVADGTTLIISGNAGTTWRAAGMTLGTSTGASLKIRNFGSVIGSAPVDITSGTLTANGTISLEVSGVFDVGSFPLIYLPQGTSIGGGGFGAFVLGALPPGVTGNLVDAGDQIILNVTSVDKLNWFGNLSSDWDINTTSNWKFGAGTATYTDGSEANFTDVATGSTDVVLNSPVAPSNVVFNNSSKNYTLNGSSGITGNTGLVKNGTGSVIIKNSNSYSGVTTVNAGTLEFGDGLTDGSISGPLTNAASVIFHPATVQTYAGAMSGTAGTIAKNGPQRLILTGANSYTGAITINAGALQIGNGATNGSIGTSNYTIAANATLALNYATATTAGPGQWSTRITGPGTLQLTSIQGANGTANWGLNAPTGDSFGSGFTGTIQIDNGRLDSSPSGMGGISKMIIKNGGQFLAWNGIYNIPVEIAGNGWGEVGYPSALRVAAAYNATWAGSITLTANAGILSQDGNSIFTLTGSITGPFECDFIRVGNIFVTPTAAVRNSYGSTKISSNGGTGIVTAGNANAFSSGGLVMNGGTLALNGFSFDFASLSGSTGDIRNNSATACVMTVGGGNAPSTFSATITNGSTGTLGLTKNGNSTQTITSTTNSYSGATTINQGVLLANNASGSATGSSAITVNSTGTLGGTGAVTGSVTVNSGGTLAPGVTIESLATGALNLAVGSTYAVEINSSGIPSADVTNVVGNATLNSALTVTDIASVPVALTIGTKLTILTYNGILTGTFTGIPEAATVTVGVNSFRIRYADAQAVTLEAVAGAGYSSWASSKGLTGANNGRLQDADSDGVNNQLEFYFNGNPLASDLTILPVMSLDATYLKLTFNRRDDAEGDLTSQTAQHGSNLIGWTNATITAATASADANGVIVTVTENGTNPDLVEVRIPRARAVNGVLFGRVLIVK
jgi:fibronectin-binding autotransporter adhesin